MGHQPQSQPGDQMRKRPGPHRMGQDFLSKFFIGDHPGLNAPRGAAFFFCLLLITACQTRPVQEIALADVAIRAAQKARADSFSPDLFREAENYYLRAKKDFADGYYDSARKHATEARLRAERAEYQAVSKQALPADPGPAGSSPFGAP